MTLRVTDVPVMQGLGDQELPKYFHDEVLFFIQPTKRDFGARLVVPMEEKRESLQNQMSDVGTNL